MEIRTRTRAVREWISVGGERERERERERGEERAQEVAIETPNHLTAAEE
jgi:hypothetical protein